MNFSKKFVCEDIRYSTYEKNIPAPIFRKSFLAEQAADRAESGHSVRGAAGQ